MVTDKELDIARAVGYRVAQSWQPMEIEDVQSSLVLWLFEHEGVVERYRDSEDGEKKLVFSLRREATRFCYKEKNARTGGTVGVELSYNLSQLQRALPFIFEDVPQTVAFEFDAGRSTYSGSHGSAVDVLVDIRSAFKTLPARMVEVLTLRYRDGLSYLDIGNLIGLSDRGAKNRVTKAVRTLHETLSGQHS